MKYDEISSNLEVVYNVIDNSKEYIAAQQENKQQYLDNAAQAGNDYSSGGNWDLENSLNKSMTLGTETTHELQTSVVAKEKYDIRTV